MTTFPRELPQPLKITSGGLTLERQISRAPYRGGLQQVAELGTPVWRAAYATVRMAETEGVAWEAWIASLRGGVRLFKAYDPWRRYCVTYPNGYGGMTRHVGGTAFDGTGTLTGIGTPRESVVIGGLPTGFRMEAGDLFSITSGSIQSLHRVVTLAVASTGTCTLECEPMIPAAVTTAGAVVQLEKPWIKAAIIQNSSRVEWQPGRRCTVSIEAWQTQ